VRISINLNITQTLHLYKNVLASMRYKATVISEENFSYGGTYSIL